MPITIWPTITSGNKKKMMEENIRVRLIINKPITTNNFPYQHSKNSKNKNKTRKNRKRRRRRSFIRMRNKRRKL